MALSITAVPKILPRAEAPSRGDKKWGKPSLNTGWGLVFISSFSQRHLVIGASLSNVVAGWLVTKGGYSLSHLVGGGIAAIAIGLFLLYRNEIAPKQDDDGASR